jgi:hypothetical protein
MTILPQLCSKKQTPSFPTPNKQERKSSQARRDWLCHRPLGDHTEQPSLFSEPKPEPALTIHNPEGEIPAVPVQKFRDRVIIPITPLGANAY